MQQLFESPVSGSVSPWVPHVPAHPATCQVTYPAVPCVAHLFPCACLQAITLDGVLAVPTCYTVRIFE